MTIQDEILKAYEPAARIYCGKLGCDPDMMVPDPDQLFIGVEKMKPVWHSVAHELHDLSMRLVSMKEAAQPKIEVH